MSLTDLWLPVLVAAAAIFVVSSIIHMALPWHCNDMKVLPDEDPIRDAFNRSGAAPGLYMVPGAKSMKAMQDEAFQKKLAEGPLGSIILRPPGSLRMGPALLQWFLLTVVLGVVIAYLATFALEPGAHYAEVFRFTASAGVLAYAFSHVQECIWKGLSWGITFRYCIDGVVYGLVTGGCFGWLWPAAA